MPPSNDLLLTTEKIRDTLSAIAAKLKSPVSLCLIGSAPGILAGQPDRTSIDIDVWQKSSTFAYADLKQACEAVGLRFNPQDEMEPDRPYIQIVEEGIVQLGKFKQKHELQRDGNLVVFRPPMENICASKLLRMSKTDMVDVGFLMARFGVTKQQVAAVIGTFPEPARTTARENLVYLDLLSAFDARGPNQGKGRSPDPSP